jgi:predicted dehydrogenase
MKSGQAAGRAMSRRRFLGAAAAGWAGIGVLPARTLGRGGAVAPNDRIVAGVIGTGSRGTDHTRSLLGDGSTQLVAVCDVFRSRAEALRKMAEERYAGAAGQGAWKGCLATQDFREVLALEGLDAVFIAAPENWHALMSIEAMRAGKDVYCEKALSLTVAEGRAVCNAVRRYGRVFQAGTQQRSDPRFRFACELARNGHLGTLKTVTVGVPGGRALPVLPVAPVPADLDYERWLGPAPFKPYREGLCSYNWYFVTDYCAGWIQSWGVHHVDIALWGAPALAATTLEVEGTATFPDEGTADASYAWDTRCVAPGGLVFRFCSDDRSPFGHGCRFEGDRGWVHVDRGRLFAEPASLLETVLRPGEERLYDSRNHQANFLECMRTRRDPAAPVEACHAATTLTLVADIATRTGRKMTWDWTAERFAGDDAASRLLSRSLRNPWLI